MANAEDLNRLTSWDSVQDSLEFGAHLRDHAAPKSGGTFSIRSLAKEWKQRKQASPQPEEEKEKDTEPPVAKKSKLSFGERLASLKKS